MRVLASDCGRRHSLAAALVALAAALQPACGLRAEPQDPPPAAAAPAAAPPPGNGETVEQALCRLIETSAGKHHLPVGFFTRLIWQESSFRPHVISPAGAQGVAQFMPGTAQERGLTDPFDPEQAIPAAAGLLDELVRRFGNIGLAAAAYNGGPARVAAWMQGTGHLPFETSDYVLQATGREADDWLDEQRGKTAPARLPAASAGCAQIVAELRRRRGNAEVAEAPFAPWGVQLAGNFSKRIALASFARARLSYQSMIGDVRPMIIGTRLRSRGTRAFYRVRVPAATRQEAGALCTKIHALHGACVVLRS